MCCVVLWRLQSRKELVVQVVCDFKKSLWWQGRQNARTRKNALAGCPCPAGCLIILRNHFNLRRLNFRDKAC